MKQKSSGFLTNVLKLVGGSAFAQGLGVLVLPILSRLFAPQAFGVAELFTSITIIISVVACLRYELSIMLPESDAEAANLFGVSVVFTIIVSLITGIVFFIFGNNISGLLHSEELEIYLWLVSPAVFFSGLFLALNYWNSRTKHFGRLSLARVASSSVNQATRLFTGFTGFVSAGALIGASILGNCISTAILGTQIWRDHGRLFRANIRWHSMLAGIRRYKKFPLFSSWSILLNSISRQLPAWFLAFYFSPQVVGFFALSRLVLSAPMRLVGNSVAQVFYQRAAEANVKTKDLQDVVEKVYTGLIALGVFPIILLTLVGKELFVVAFGSQWAEAGIYTQVLAIWIFFQFISSPISTLASVFEKQDSLLVFSIVLFLTRVLSLIAGGMFGSVYIALLLFALTGVCCYGFLSFWLMGVAGVSIRRSLNIILKYTMYSMPFLLLMLLLKWWMRIGNLGIFLMSTLLLCLYYLIVIMRSEELREPVAMIFRKVHPSAHNENGLE